MSKIGKLLIDATTSNIIVTRKVPFKGTLGGRQNLFGRKY